jgi:uncharacterized protein (DUF2336 family)
MMNNEAMKRATDAAQQLAVLIPYLSTEALVDLVMIGNAPCLAALAKASPVKAPVAAALVEIGEEATLLHLLGNPSAIIASFSYIRMIERFSRSESILGAIEARSDLNDDIWAALASARLKTIVDMIDDKREPDLVEQALIALLWAAEGEVRSAYISAFIRFDCVTPKLIAIALLNDALEVVIDLLASLSGEGPATIHEMITKSDGVAFRKLLKQCGFTVAVMIECEAAFLRATAKPSGSFSVAA